MPFRNRNSYYLRISAKNVLPLHLYLDERHTDWMSDKVLQHVLADLRPLILPKLQAEANFLLGSGGPSNAKQASVDVHRGDSYQFAFFFRKTEPHSVIIKTRKFVATLREHKNDILSPGLPPTKGRTCKRKPQAPSEKAKGRKKMKIKGKAKAPDDEDDVTTSEEDFNGANDRLSSAILRRSGRSKKAIAGGYREDDDDETSMNVDSEIVNGSTEEVTITGSASTSANGLSSEMPVKDEVDGIRLTNEPPPELIHRAESLDVEIPSPPPDLEIGLDEEESKPKPRLQIKYQGFNIYGHCLCVVVEPWPLVRSQTRAPSVAPGPSTPRAPSIAPADFVPGGGRLRAQTPLFIPDFDRGRSETPAPFVQQRVLPPVPLFNREPHDDDGSDSEIIQFSQVLNSAGDFRAQGEDDDEMDGAVFFGDADEEVRAL